MNYMNSRQQQRMQRVPYMKQQKDMHSDKADVSVEKTEEKYSDIKPPAFGGLDDLLKRAGSDRILILLMLAVLYSEGGSRKLMLALAYLLI